MVQVELHKDNTKSASARRILSRILADENFKMIYILMSNAQNRTHKAYT